MGIRKCRVVHDCQYTVLYITDELFELGSELILAALLLLIEQVVALVIQIQVVYNGHQVFVEHINCHFVDRLVHVCRLVQVDFQLDQQSDGFGQVLCSLCALRCHHEIPHQGVADAWV